METISIQLNKIETKLEGKERIKTPIWLNPVMPSKEFLRQRINGSQSLFKIDREIVPNLETKMDKVIETLTKKLEKLESKLPSSSHCINTIDKEEISSEEDIRQLEKIFQVEESSKNVLRIQRTPLPRPKTKDYYLRPPPPDLQYIERSQTTQSSYDRNVIYEWNIDEISKHQMLNILQETTMAASTHKSKKIDDVTIARYLIIGLTDQLKNWWDNYLRLTEQRFIVENRNEQGESTLDTLVFSIIKHFIGNHAMFHNKTSEIL